MKHHNSLRISFLYTRKNNSKCAYVSFEKAKNSAAVVDKRFKCSYLLTKQAQFLPNQFQLTPSYQF